MTAVTEHFKVSLIKFVSIVKLIWSSILRRNVDDIDLK